MQYILVIIMSTGFVHSVEFNSMRACEKTREALMLLDRTGVSAAYCGSKL